MRKPLTVDELEKRKRELEKIIKQLKAEDQEIREKYEKAKKLEDELYNKLMSTRDDIERARLELKYMKAKEYHSKFAQKLEEVEKKLRGAIAEYEEVSRMIEYLKPKGRFVEESNS